MGEWKSEEVILVGFEPHLFRLMERMMVRAKSVRPAADWDEALALGQAVTPTLVMINGSVIEISEAEARADLERSSGGEFNGVVVVQSMSTRWFRPGSGPPPTATANAANWGEDLMRIFRRGR